jgi:hypothetical protein
MKKIICNGQMRKHFFIVIYRSSLVKAAVNGLRICAVVLKKRLSLDGGRADFSKNL